MHERGGVRHLRVSGKGEKTRYVPLHGIARDLIEEYMAKSGHGGNDKGALFRPLRNARGGGREKRNYAGWRLKAGPSVFSLFGVRNRGPCLARNGSNQRARSSGRHREGPRMAGSFEHRDDPAV